MQVAFRVNPAGFANKSRKKWETVTDNAHVRTVRATKKCAQQYHINVCKLSQLPFSYGPSFITTKKDNT